MQAAQRLCAERSQQRHWYRQQHDERQHEAFILRRERQIHDQHSQAKQDDRRSARRQFFERQPCPFVGETLGQNFLAQILHGGDGLPGAETLARRAVNFRRAKQVVVADHLRRRSLCDAGQVLQRNHRASIRAHIVLLHVFRLRAELLVGLDINAVRTIVEIEIVDVRRTHVDAESIRDLLQRDVQALGFLAINGDQKLRIACGVAAEQARQVFARVALANHVLRYFRQLFQECEPWSCTSYWKPPNWPRPWTAGGKKQSTSAPVIPETEPRNRFTTASAECSATFALRVARQPGIDDSAVGRAVAGDGENVFHFRHLAHDCADLILDVPDVVRGRAGRGLDDDREITLILVRDEACGHALENHEGEPQSREKQHHRDQTEAKESAQGAPISLGDGADDAVHLAEEPAFLPVHAAEQEVRRARA